MIQGMTTPPEEGIQVNGNQLRALMENFMELIGQHSQQLLQELNAQPNSNPLEESKHSNEEKTKDENKIDQWNENLDFDDDYDNIGGGGEQSQEGGSHQNEKEPGNDQEKRAEETTQQQQKESHKREKRQSQEKTSKETRDLGEGSRMEKKTRLVV